MSESVYRPLKEREIRVLVLHPGDRVHPLKATLKHVIVPSTPPIGAGHGCFSKDDYHTISYAWGQPVFDHVVSLLGWNYIHSYWAARLLKFGFKGSRIEPVHLPITKSLSDALKHFRHPHTKIQLWADQICINQGYMEEKCAQIAMMADVYRCAAKVDVWLGLPEPGHEMAFTVATFLIETGYRRLTDLREEWTKAHQNMSLEEGLSAFSTITNKTWFERVWVVQEVLNGTWDAVFHLGDDIVNYGQLMAAFEYFTSAVEKVGSSDGGTSPAMAAMPTLNARKENKVRELYSGRPSVGGIAYSCPMCTEGMPAVLFMDLLVKTSHLKASEPRDRVFALISVAKIASEDMVKVDYTIAESGLWRCVTQFFLDTLGSAVKAALVLALPATQCTSTRASSSWVTDYGALTSESHRKWRWYQSESKYSAGSGGVDFNWKRRGSHTFRRGGEGILHHHAVLLGQVQNIHPASSMPLLSSSIGEVARRFLLIYLICTSFYDQADDFTDYDGFVLLLAQGQGSWEYWDASPLKEALKSTIAQHTRPGLTEVRELIGELALVSSSSSEDPDKSTSMEVSVSRRLHEETLAKWTAMLRRVLRTEDESCTDHTRLLATTIDGDLGWVPAKTQLGDRICVLQGCPAPFVVCEADDGCYKIAGDAYTRGVMKGEAWPEKHGAQSIAFG